MKPRRVLVILLAWLSLGVGFGGSAQPDLPVHAAAPTADGCIQCHAGIEDIHPGFKLSCVDCHGGDASATDKARAHVAPPTDLPGDERVLGPNYRLDWQRFQNPANLRVAATVCGDCHRELVDHVHKSLHATTSGHLGDGYYEHGLVDHKRPRFGVFPVRDEDGVVPPGALTAVEQVPPPRKSGRTDSIEHHYGDLPRKACMQCHLHSDGRAVRGRLGLDGEYRGEGCAACHVTYAEDGRSRSRDTTIDKLEPGHPLEHRFTSKIPTATCTTCHYGDASIGLSFRGLAQLVPGMPAGPDVPNTTDRLLNGAFYMKDPITTPPDVHHAAGMHCIDCHTSADTMGDGNLWPQMDHAVEIECSSCHGTFDRVTDLTTSKGRRVTNLVREGEEFWLVSKVTGRRHRVKQARDVIAVGHRDHNGRAGDAMTTAHASLECYACHSGWNPNFFGFHFDRNLQFTQLDLLSGERTAGRVTTQEKVFATFHQLRLGKNHEGMVAPYMVGFSTIGSAHDEKGEAILHQHAPLTKTGLSGVTLVPHQPHTVQSRSRSCVECHRSSTTYGLGSSDFRLTREIGWAITESALVGIAFDPKTPQQSAPFHALDLPGEVAAMALAVDERAARASFVFLALRDGRLAVVDVGKPASPELVRTLDAAFVRPRAMLVRAGTLWVADGPAGVRAFDVRDPKRPTALSITPTRDATALDMAWPWLCVADGHGGLAILDGEDPANPKVIASVDLNGGSSEPNECRDVRLHFQYERRVPGRGAKDPPRVIPARLLAAVAGGLDGVRLVDLTEPTKPVVLWTPSHRRSFEFERGDVRSVAVNTVFDLGTDGGGVVSGERVYLYVELEVGSDDNRQQSLQVLDITDPMNPRALRGGSTRLYGGPGRLRLVRAYNAPFLQHFVAAVGAGGLGTLVDTTRAAAGELRIAATWDDLADVRDLWFEEMAFDRLVDERGDWIKDISHEDCGYLTPQQISRVLRVAVPIPQYRLDQYGQAIGESTNNDGRR
ncbi:MAG: hypothetical protein AB7T19_02115 [Planctomycetota bacterium]